jgi:acetylornithine deacetylase
VRAMLSAMAGSGLSPRIGAWRAASDAGLLSGRTGIPCVLFGPGDTAQAHRPDEFVDLAQLATASEVIARLLKS